MSTKRLTCLAALAISAMTAATAEAQWSELARSRWSNTDAVAAKAPASGESAILAQAAKKPRNQAIAGTWMETVTPEGDGAPPPFVSLVTFNADGTTTVADQGNVTAETVFSAGHGVWQHTHGRVFVWTVIELVSAPDGSLIGIFTIVGEYTVNGAQNAYTGHFGAELRSPSGELIFGATGSNQGHRVEQ